VIGGGLAGLTAAVTLARAGERVTLFEKAREPGGRARTDEIGGFRFDMGPHALYLGSVAFRTFRELGIPVNGRVPKLGNRALFGGKLFGLPADARSLLTTRLLPLSAKIETARLLSRLPEALPGESVGEWIPRIARHERTRALLRALVRVTTYCADPRVSAAAVREQLGRAQKGVWYLEGGWQSLVSGLRQAAIAAGVEIETGARVESLEVAGGRVRALALAGGRRVETAAAILAVDPHTAGALLGRAFETIPVRAACLGLALRRLPRPEVGFALGIDAPTYFSVHSRVVPVAPEGSVLLHALKYLPPEDDGSTAEAELESMLDTVQPGWRAEVIHRRWLPHMTVVNALPGHRPAVEIDGIANAFLAGDWVGDEAMLADTAIASALRASESALRARRVVSAAA
jgi:phytoene dehydrogenase-like protein